MTRSIDRGLAAQGLGRAHHRALYFIARQPDLTVRHLLALLAITKQSLGRVLNELAERGLIESRPRDHDRRQRPLRWTDAGAKLETESCEAIRTTLPHAYGGEGPKACDGFVWVSESSSPETTKHGA